MNGREREGKDPGAGRLLAVVAFLFGVFWVEYQNNLESSGPLLVPSHRNNLDYMGFLLGPSGAYSRSCRKKNRPCGALQKDIGLTSAGGLWSVAQKSRTELRYFAPFATEVALKTIR